MLATRRYSAPFRLPPRRNLSILSKPTRRQSKLGQGRPRRDTSSTPCVRTRQLPQFFKLTTPRAPRNRFYEALFTSRRGSTGRGRSLSQRAVYDRAGFKRWHCCPPVPTRAIKASGHAHAVNSRPGNCIASRQIGLLVIESALITDAEIEEFYAHFA